MKAVILSAGQGSRLLPLTERRPKCLLELQSRSLLEWQIHELGRAGVDEIVVVVGFQAAAVERVLERLASDRLEVRAVFNPFFQVADNLGTCWMARNEMQEDFLLINGDTLFESAVVDRLLYSADAPVNVAIDRTNSYDDDDMKVVLDGRRLVDIAKTIDPGKADGESIGMMLFRGEGPRLFVDEVDSMMRATEGVGRWFTSAVSALAKTGVVSTVSIEGLSWGEVDYPVDLKRAREMVRRWVADEAATAPRQAVP